jgi:branched-chain amino acid transport system ATP-binding protein/urea transport system ATP-binding protein
MLTIDGLEAGYRGSRVLNGLDLEVAEGAIAALLGRNGMGKTTLMRALMGLLPVAAGRILFQGRDIAGLRPFEISNLGIAYVPQGREIFADFTVEQNLRLGLVGKPGGAGAIPASVYRHFPILAERRGQKAGTLSGGEQQQLAIARALVGRPWLLLLDEPSEGIQPSIVLEIARTLKRIAADEGLTVLLVEQNVEMVLSLAADCAFIENGRVVARHAAAEIARDRETLHRYLAV